MKWLVAGGTMPSWVVRSEAETVRRNGRLAGHPASVAGPGARPESRSGSRWMARSTLAVVASTGALAAGLTLASRDWPLVHDGPIMHYVAARLLAGAVPYRDLFDMNLPGVYAVHALGLTWLGPGAGAFRLLDLAMLAAAVAGLAVALRAYGGWAVAAAGALFWAYHLAGGAWRAGQRDLILCVPLAWATAGLMAHVHPHRRGGHRPGRGAVGPVGLAGLALGQAVWLKPHALAFLPLAIALLLWPARPGRMRALAAFGAGLAAPTAIAVGWLGASGGLGAFVDILTGYLLPLYGRLGREPLLPAVLGHDLGLPVAIGLGLWAGAGLATLLRAGRAGPETALLVGGVVYGVLHFALQGKGWEYHLYPLALFAVALGAAGLGVAVGGSYRAAGGVLLVALVVTTGALGFKGTRNVAPAWIAEKHARALEVARLLAPVAARGETVQVLDTTDGGVHALYLVGARQPTRFLYDFHFYHDVAHPYVAARRRELLGALSRAPPGAVVLFERGWPRGGYERLEAFPELAAWLGGGYRLAHQGQGYRLYLRGLTDAP